MVRFEEFDKLHLSISNLTDDVLSLIAKVKCLEEELRQFKRALEKVDPDNELLKEEECEEQNCSPTICECSPQEK